MNCTEEINTEIKRNGVDTVLIDINIKVSQKILEENNLNLKRYLILTEINKSKSTTVEDLYAKYPVVYNKVTARNNLNTLVEMGLLQNEEDDALVQLSTKVYTLTKKGLSIATNIPFKPKYSTEEYIKAIKVI